MSLLCRPHDVPLMLMRRAYFEAEGIVATLNAHFVSVKVDC